MGKIFGIVGLLVGTGLMVLIDGSLMQTIENRRRYTAVYGTLVTLFLVVSALQILWAP